ncbi:lipase family protein (macronuclear) [Tetrahymena thermophila SB210]|uniref:Lipase family protein n=1 Tax=Tetrahymena thermophila (strain SB210) TaxID=312017 RepID=I7MCP1_TETTS|nr:lipase family protein [Tetrahymena thermophila SB210]EAR84464.2 lipase family protein [Tetrahymena thermophila SB210]|eukprot:XP_001032127.2 lipase family protein [Tetrahymena thermophila SB210]
MQYINVFENKEKNSQGFCGYNPIKHQIIIAIRGTANLNNWITNLKAFPVDFPDCDGCQIHMGFRDHAQSIQNHINQCVKNILEKYVDANVIITGHSLGGAIATLISVEVLKYLQPKNQISLYTFGAPKIGNQNFVEYLNQIIPNSYRIVNYYDAVPHLPFKQILDFRHHGYEIWMTNPNSINQFKVCQHEDEQCSSQVSLLNFSVQNHISYFGIYTGCNKEQYQKEFQEHQNEELQKYLNRIYQQLEKQVS